MFGSFNHCEALPPTSISPSPDSICPGFLSHELCDAIQRLIAGCVIVMARKKNSGRGDHMPIAFLKLTNRSCFSIPDKNLQLSQVSYSYHSQYCRLYFVPCCDRFSFSSPDKYNFISPASSRDCAIVNHSLSLSLKFSIEYWSTC